MLDSVSFKVFKFLTYDIFELPAVKLFNGGLSIVAAILVLIQTLVFIHKGEVDYLIQYGTGYMFTITFVCVIIFAQKTSAAIRNLMEDLKGLNFKLDATDMKDKINRKIIRATTFVLLHVALSFSASLYVMLPKETDIKLYYFLPWLEIFPNKWRNTIEWCIRFPIVLGGTTINIFPLYHLVYAFNIVNIQVNILLNDIETMNSGREIRKKIIFCVDKHIKLMRMFRKGLRVVEVVIFPSQILIGLIYISCMCFCFSAHDYNIELTYLQIGLTFLSISMVLVQFCHTAQNIEDWSEIIFSSLMEVDWCDWSEADKKLYLIFLTNAAKPLRLKFSENLAINYRTGVQIVNSVLSYTWVIYQLKFQNK